jgi:hypothetical protein
LSAGIESGLGVAVWRIADWFSPWFWRVLEKLKVQKLLAVLHEPLLPVLSGMERGQ